MITVFGMFAISQLTGQWPRRKTMGKGDSKHKSRFAGQRRRQKKHMERMKRKAMEVHSERAVSHGGVLTQVRPPQQPQMKRAILQMNGQVRCPYCSYMDYYGRLVPGVRVVQCGSCRRNFELEVKEEELKVVPIMHDDYAFCPHCGRKCDVLNSGGRGTVITCNCGKRFKLGEKQAPPQSPKPVEVKKPQVKRNGNSPWCTCPNCSRGVRVKGSYTITVPATCPECGLEFDALPA